MFPKHRAWDKTKERMYLVRQLNWNAKGELKASYTYT